VSISYVTDRLIEIAECIDSVPRPHLGRNIVKIQRSAWAVIVRARNDIGWAKYDNAESVWKERLSLRAPPWIKDEIMLGVRATTWTMRRR
jgi:hypothetical protein